MRVWRSGSATASQAVGHGEKSHHPLYTIGRWWLESHLLHYCCAPYYSEEVVKAARFADLKVAPRDVPRCTMPSMIVAISSRHAQRRQESVRYAYMAGGFVHRYS